VKTPLLLADIKYHNVVQSDKMAMPVKTNQAATTGARQENDMENQAVTIETVLNLAQQLGAIGKDANQTQLAEAIAGHSLIEIAAVNTHGQNIIGSSERAVAAWFNEKYPPSVTELNWYETKNGDKTDMSKKIAGDKKALYTTWGSANNSTKWGGDGRVQDLGAELAKPMLLELIAALPEDERAEAYLDNNLVDPASQPEEETNSGSGSGKPSRTRDLYERNVVELGKLYRSLNSAENDPIIKAHAKKKELEAVLLHVTNGLKALGAPLEDSDLKKFMGSIAKR
jgi:hypothetical protein